MAALVEMEGRSSPLFSPYWHRVAELRPRLRAHTQIHRQIFRGDVWYLLQDHSSGRFHRYTPQVNFVLTLMDGERTLDEIWQIASARYGNDCPGQDECIYLLSQLHSADVLNCDVPPELEELTSRAKRGRFRRRLAAIRSPLAIRLPMVDPDQFLNATHALVKPLFSWFGVLIWFGLVVSAIILAGIHWEAFTHDFTGRILAADNLILLWLAFPVVKLVHELGHGYAAKVWGGEVHEMGIMMLVFIPVPYVEVSSSTAFDSKWQRAFVGAAGMLFELPFAALAMWLWVEAEPGLIRSLAYNIVLIASISTLLFNGNPLLRYDGYYILADLLEMPNLAKRANSYIGYLVQRYLFGATEVPSPAETSSEPLRLALFAVSSFFYRVFILTAIVLFVASKFFTIGILLAIWSVILMFIWPTIKFMKHLLVSTQLRRNRFRAISVTTAISTCLVSLIMLVPLPHGTVLEGVVWAPEKSMVRARVQGVVSNVNVSANEFVQKGQVLMELSDPLLHARVLLLRARLEELTARFNTTAVANKVQRNMLHEQVIVLREQAQFAENQKNELEIKSQRNGQIIIQNITNLSGKFIKRGELIAYVMDYDRPVIRVAAPQQSIDLLRKNTQSVAIRLAHKPSEVLEAQLKMMSPRSTREIPFGALTREGGGWISLDPSSPPAQRMSLEELYFVELALVTPVKLDRIGERAYVRFDHGLEPLGWQIYRAIRQVFLERFNV